MVVLLEYVCALSKADFSVKVVHACMGLSPILPSKHVILAIRLASYIIDSIYAYIMVSGRL